MISSRRLKENEGLTHLGPKALQLVSLLHMLRIADCISILPTGVFRIVGGCAEE